MKSNIMEIPILFHESLSASTFIQLINEVLIYILYQRQQTPFHYHMLKQAASALSSSNEKQKCVNDPEDISFEDILQKKYAIKEKLKKNKKIILAKKAKMRHDQLIMQIYDQITALLKHLHDVLAQHIKKIKQIVLILGPNLVSPKEIYHIHVPNFNLVPLSSHVSFERAKLHILRCLMMSEKLHSVWNNHVPLSNIYVIFHSELLPFSDLWLIDHFKTSDRCSQVHIKFHLQRNISKLLEQMNLKSVQQPLFAYQLPVVLRGVKLKNSSQNSEDLL